MISRRSVVGDSSPAALPPSCAPLPAEPISVRIAVAVRLTGISRSRIYELIETGDIETKKIGRSTFVLYRSLKRLLEGAS
jgi:hypothetical protein